jgi:hypothetical protein
MSDAMLMTAQSKVAQLLETYTVESFKYYWVLQDIDMILRDALGMDMNGEMMASMNIAELAMGTESLSTLAMIVEDLDLGDTLMSD